MKSIVVRAFWDSETKVWVASSEDVPGLATEAETIDELTAKLKTMIPELIKANGLAEEFHGEVPLYLMAEQVSKIQLSA
ncbi:MAG: DUF1902 domain-containing protein [Proteobacteria bacterium]|nr:DUF1902 domain-containing protein [Pseudomonadota bacterium]